MLDRASHLSDAEIVQLIDLEGPRHAAESAREHVLACAACSARLANIERALGKVDDLLGSQTRETLPSAIASRVRLQESLRMAGVSSEGQRRNASRSFVWIGAMAAMGLVVAGLAVPGWRQALLERPVAPQYAGAGPVPNRMLTPGAIRPVTLGEICQSTNDDDLDPSVTPAIKNAVLREYGIAGNGSGETYQIDYLVNPQLGGTSDIKNLWPQPFHEGVWNALAKDQLEKHLHEMVCNRTVELTVAQQEIATDWIAAYRKYLHGEPS